jgi:hypothetical protein
MMTAGSSQTTEPQIAPDPAVGAIAGFEAAPDGYTIDAFHNGGFFLVQPSDAGHRAGMDAMLLAATVADGATGSLADLGRRRGRRWLGAANRIDPLSRSCWSSARRRWPIAPAARFACAKRPSRRARQVLEADVSLRGTAQARGGPGGCVA